MLAEYPVQSEKHSHIPKSIFHNLSDYFYIKYLCKKLQYLWILCLKNDKIKLRHEACTLYG